jgi:hypothetical protein
MVFQDELFWKFATTLERGFGPKDKYPRLLNSDNVWRINDDRIYSSIKRASECRSIARVPGRLRSGTKRTFGMLTLG